MTNEEREALIAQGWTPPVAVDPDVAEAKYMAQTARAERLTCNGGVYDLDKLALIAIKRGRELERAEAKPKGPQTAALQAGSAGYRDWQDITHYAIITPPEDVA